MGDERYLPLEWPGSFNYLRNLFLKKQMNEKPKKLTPEEAYKENVPWAEWE